MNEIIGSKNKVLVTDGQDAVTVNRLNHLGGIFYSKILCNNGEIMHSFTAVNRCIPRFCGYVFQYSLKARYSNGFKGATSIYTS